ncbi:MAG: hypothetical protein WC749_06430 [Dehalococcoidia bacterium]
MKKIIRKKLVGRSQAYFWTREWQKAEKEADEDIKSGRVENFDSAEELLKDLE